MPNPTADYPLALHTDVDISVFANNPLGSTTPKHTEVEGKQEEEIRAIQEKLGIGLSNAASATALQVLQKQISGETLWSSLTTASMSDSLNRRYLTDAQQVIIANFNENVEDIIGSKVIAGTNISVSYNDTTGETTITGSAGGEVNTASNVGSAGIGVFKQKTGVDLEFKKLFALSTKIDLVDDTANSRITLDVNQANLTLTASQITDFDTEVSNNTDVAANTAARHAALTISDTDTVNLTLATQLLSADVRSQMSITSDASGIKLSGDATTPGNSKYYGTNGSGTKGFYDLPSGGSVDSVNGQTGVVVLDTDDIAEGVTNLYLTSERIDDRVAALLVQGTGITLTYNDPANTLTIATTITQYTDEMVDDRVATLIQNGTGISWSYDDTANTLTPTISLASFSTTNLAEGTNLYYTAARFNTAFAAKSTTDLTEGSNLYFTNERVDDRVAALLTQGTGITLTYDDVAGTLTVATTITQYTDEMARDAIGAALVAGAGITITPDDGADTITIASSITQYTDEMAQDTVATLIQNGTGISWSYNDGANTLTPTVSLASFSTTNLSEGSNLYYTDERVDDRVAALIQNGTGISWTYSDAGGTLTPAVSLASFSTTNLTEGSNLYFTSERVDDRVAALLVQGANITLTYDDTANTLTIAATASSPGGLDTYVQYNDGGAFGGDNTFTFNETTNVLTFQEGITTGLRRATDDAALAIFGGSAYDHGAYFNVTGKDYATFPGKGSAEFIIGQTTGADGVSSCFKLVSQDYVGNFTTRFRVEGSNGHVTIGLGTNAARFHHIGSADEIQMIIEAHSTQNQNMLQFRASDDSVQMAIAGNGRDFVLDTTTGSKIGTAITQKLGFWNATPVVQSTGWSVTNETSDKVFDANSTSIDELADVLGTLIETMKTYGLLGG